MAQKIIITIDGYSSCGKSTLAKDLAKKLGYRYIDTGAMYRAVTLYLLQNLISFDDTPAVVEALNRIHLDIEYDKESGKQIILLNGISVEKEIRQKPVSDNVSPVSSIKEVRKFCVAQQQKMGNRKAIVMDGRDIGTVVFPKAELKIFLTAEPSIRIERRYNELQAQPGMEMTYQEVAKNLTDRDYMDSHREESPLRQAADAIVLDNSHLTQEEQVDWVMEYVIERMVKRTVKQ
ncbi:MAG: (d)CMP kinase [Bacteroidetes bacterium]|nr:(d)CMP kinase [Bacteroidota bacterium]